MNDVITKEGHNCWRRASAGRVACLIDAAEYYARLYDAIVDAERSIYIVGWDIDSRTPLFAEQHGHELPIRLGELLDEVCRRRPELHVYVLCWDYSMIYALEREPFPTITLGWRTHDRMHFALDDNAPIGGSTHHKIVVIDEKLAFTGGIDICNRRWDTPEHRADDPRRIDLRGHRYLPHHDLQLALDGAAAETVASYVRARWELATGKHLSPQPGSGDPWPAGLQPSFRDVQVVLARTLPAMEGSSGVREVEQLFLDAIAAAERFIYIENPYPTSPVLAEALATRLRELEGPEVVLVGPHECSGWLEEVTMGVLRGRFIRTLDRADDFNRLGVFSAMVAGHDDQQRRVPVKVHGKCMIVDDRLLRIGSANMSNRSLGLDAELDVQLEAEGDARTQAAIAEVRAQLMGEHLGVSPGTVEREVQTRGSLLAAIESLHSEGRTLQPDREQWMRAADQPLPDQTLIDPEQPVSPARLMELFTVDPSRDRRRVVRWKMLGLALLVLVSGGIALAGAQGVVDTGGLVRWTTTLKGAWYAPLALMAVFVVAGMVFVPVTLMIATAGLLFGPWLGSVYGLTAGLTSAVVYYGLGRWLGRESVRELAGPRLNKISRMLAQRGLFAVAAVRTFPVAPHVVVGLVAGTSHIGFRDYLVGSLIAMAPGTVVLAFLGHQVGASVREPDAANLAWLAVIGIAVLVVAWTMQRWLGQRQLAAPS